jgi:hypothetical protein
VVDNLLIEKINQLIQINGFNHQIGMQSVIFKNYLISQILLLHLFIMLNNGKNGICRQIHKSNHFLDNGIKNVIV